MNNTEDIARVLTISTPDIENGYGNRVTIWLAGCSHHCEHCHNKHTWSYNQGKELLSEEILNKIFAEVDKPYIDGITLSGGDPLSRNDNNLNQVLDFIIKFREKYTSSQKDIWIYAGDTFEEAMQHPIKKSILGLCDVMVDGTFKLELYDRDLAFRGSKNQRIINLASSFEKNKVVQIDFK